MIIRNKIGINNKCRFLVTCNYIFYSKFPNKNDHSYFFAHTEYGVL